MVVAREHGRVPDPVPDRGIAPGTVDGVMDELTKGLLEARHGSQASLTSAIRVAQPEVWRLCASLTSREHADDLTQETFVRAYQSLARFRGDSSGRTWLFSIARRVCADELRARRRRARRDARFRTTMVEPDHAGEATVTALLDALDEDQRVAFALTQVIGCSYDEAATICDVPIGTIRSRVARARAALVSATRQAAAE